ncbi:Aste57867_24533 [Aphanomyces stellatus]|uniref:Aste57867_24533 protein n=1 Tax=Aphanomyces stellatus TaxID=120398 RepID=A0A485LQL7_9STRA|nr:hypothetical protein As57867_024456 [Aphanomyces stellatus]VFU01172.1 Aste57867_24533 [Aphanomyces stellatus]
MKIVVVGGGIVGLSTALALLEHGFQDVKVVADNFEDTTSHTAGAVWRPVFAGTTSERTMDKWGHETMLWLRQLMERHGTDVVGIKRTPGMELHDAPTDAHPYWAHSVENFRFLTHDEAMQFNKPFGFSYTSVMIHSGVLMAWMTAQIKARGGTFETRHVDSLNDDLQGDIVINCTGLGAGALVGDKAVYPVRGQVIKVFNPAITRFLTVEGPGTIVYILPRHNGEITLGGTAQAHDWRTTNDDADVARIMAECAKYMPEIKDSKLLFAKAGLRPTSSSGTRVELDPKRTSTGSWVIHNYGHGGSGHTIHRGCASDVVQLVRRLHAKL